MAGTDGTSSMNSIIKVLLQPLAGSLAGGGWAVMGNAGSYGRSVRVIEDKSTELDVARWKPFVNLVHTRLGGAPSFRVNVH